MPESEIYLAPPSDPGTLVLSPQSLEYQYQRVNDTDVLTVFFTDARAGSCCIALHPLAARHIEAHLSAMLADLDVLRREFDARSTVQND